MYLLPITTYFDYLKASKKWTVYTGGTILLSLMLSSSQNDDAKSNLYTLNKVNMPEIISEHGQLMKSNGSTLQAAALPENLSEAQEAKPEILAYEEKLIIQEDEIPFESEKKLDLEVAPGQSTVVTQGATGLRRSIVSVTLIGDQVVKREVINSQVLREPVKKIIAMNPGRAPVSRGQSLPTGAMTKGEMIVEATAYSFTGNRTATGAQPSVGMIAVDPRVIPLGTKVFIEGYGYAVAADTGGAIKGNKIDVFFNTVKECIGWGRRRVKLYILPQ